MKRKKSESCCGEVIIVAGTNTDVDYETALGLASEGAKVILVCRNPLLAEEVKRKITAEIRNENVVVELIDFAALESLKPFAKVVNSIKSRSVTTVDTVEDTHLADHEDEDDDILAQINNFGYFLLKKILIHLLKKFAQSRTFKVSKGDRKHGILDANNVNESSDDVSLLTNILGIDADNKNLFSVLMSNVLAERLEGTRVLSNSHRHGLRVHEFFSRTLEEGGSTRSMPVLPLE